MTLHHRPRSARGAVARIAIGAAASLALVASTGMTAGATEDATVDDPDATSQSPTESSSSDETVPPTSEDGTAPEPTTGTTPAPAAPAAPGAPSSEAPPVAEDVTEDDVVPNYGSQKVRVGVQLADGSWVPEGTTLDGSTLQITITGGVDEEGEPLPTETSTCTTSGHRVDDGVPVSTCFGPSGTDTHPLGPGQTMTIQHLTAPAGIQVNPDPLVIEPCTTTGQPGTPCYPGDLGPMITPGLVSVTGALPTLAPDAASTPVGTPVTIDVLLNDDAGNGAPITEFAISEQPAHGTATIVGELPPVEDPEFDGTSLPLAGPSPVQVVYTPAAGFSGTDTFVYAVTTPNGTVTATVTVQVLAAVTPPAEPPTRGELPSVGGPDAGLVALGALLVTAGAATVAARRRREEVRGALA